MTWRTTLTELRTFHTAYTGRLGSALKLASTVHHLPTIPNSAAMVHYKHMGTFVKGYELNDQKIGSFFGFDGLAEPRKVEVHVTAIVRTALDDEAYEALAVANRVDHKGTPVFVLVLDDDDDLEKLMERPLLKPLHWSIDQADHGCP